MYNSHLRGPVTLALIADRLTVELTLPVLATGLLQTGFEHPTFRMQDECFNRLRHRHGSKFCDFSIYQ